MSEYGVLTNHRLIEEMEDCLMDKDIDPFYGSMLQFGWIPEDLWIEIARRLEENE